MQLCSISLLVLLLHCVNAIFEPKISSTQFSGAPELVYFEDTDVCISFATSHMAPMCDVFTAVCVYPVFTNICP